MPINLDYKHFLYFTATLPTQVSEVILDQSIKKNTSFILCVVTSIQSVISHKFTMRVSSKVEKFRMQAKSILAFNHS